MVIAQQATPEKTAESAAVADLRRAAVADIIARIKEAERTGGVNYETLAVVRDILKDLAAQKELFPESDFPIVIDEKGQNPIYMLAKDDDHRFALYMSCSKGVKKVPPHNHTTWAVIVGVQGDEENFFYERSDDGSQPGKGTLRRTGNETVTPGRGVMMMPEDIHHIETHGDTQTLHLHMYGLGLDQLHERVLYDMEEGTFRVFPASQNILDAR